MCIVLSMAKRNFVITKKGLSDILCITRTTLDKRLSKVNVDLSNPVDVLSFIYFYGGTGKVAKWFSDFVYKNRGERCELCGTEYNLQIAHITPRRDQPEKVYFYTNVRVLCIECHKKTERREYKDIFRTNSKLVRKYKAL